MSKLLLAIPRILRSAHEDDKIAAVALLTNYLFLLHRFRTASKPSVLSRLLLALEQLLEVDWSQVNTSTAATVGINVANVGNRYPALPAKHFRHERAVVLVHMACRILGYTFSKANQLLALVSNLCTRIKAVASMNSDYTCLPARITILNQVVLGGSGFLSTTTRTLDDTLPHTSWRRVLSPPISSTLQSEQQLNLISVAPLRDHLMIAVDLVLETYLDDRLCERLAANATLIPEPSMEERDDSHSALGTLDVNQHDDGDDSEEPTTLERMKRAKHAASISGRPMHVASTPIAENSSAQQIVAACMLAEGLGDMAQVLGTRFEVFLVRSLFPLVQWLGDSRELLADFAAITLERMFYSLEYRLSRIEPHVGNGTDAAASTQTTGSSESEKLESHSNTHRGQLVASMIARNVDYLLDTAVLRMKHLDAYPLTPLVLRSILLFADIDYLLHHMPLLLQEVLDTVFHSLERGDISLSHTLIGILHSSTAILLQIQHRQQPPTQSPPPPPPDATPTNSERSIPAQLEQVLNEREEQHEPDDLVEPGMDSEPEEPPLPPIIGMVMRVLSQLQHFVSLKDGRTRSLVLETITNCVRIVGPGYRNKLLPLAHLLWKPLLTRITAIDPRTLRSNTSLVGIHATIAPTVGGVDATTGSSSAATTAATRGEHSSEQQAMLAATAALDVVLELSHHCKDFFKQRFMAELWPVLVRHLPTYHESLLQQLSGSGKDVYSFSPAFRLQRYERQPYTSSSISVLLSSNPSSRSASRLDRLCGYWHPCARALHSKGGR